MKIQLRSTLAGVATLAIAGGFLLGGASSAFAAGPPTYEPDSNALGTVSFYDNSGNQITSGSLDSVPFVPWLKASTNAPAGSAKAINAFYTPVQGATPASWQTGEQQSTAQTWPQAGAPGALAGASQPVVHDDGGLSFQTHIDDFTSTDSTDPNIYQVRIAVTPSAAYWATDIQIDPVAHTWTQLYPTPPVAVTTAISAITATPGSPAPAGTTSVGLAATLTAGDGSHPAGSVELFNGATDLGAATLNSATGAISKTATVADSTTYNFKFVYTPAGGSGVSASTSPVLTYKVKGAAQATSTVLTGPGSGSVGDNLTFTANVTSGSPAAALTSGDGSVQFKVDGSNVGSPVPLSSTGSANFSYPASSAGTKSVTASFIPADPTAYVASDSNAVTVVISAPTNNPDPQNVTVNVPAGTLVISTPYTVANPFKLGTMQLNAAGTQYHASAPFGDPAAAAATDPGNLGTTALPTYPASKTNNGVTITDTRTGSTGWTASAQTTDFTNSGLATIIPGDNLSFLNVTPKYLTGNALQAGSVNTHDITAFKTAKKAFADTTHGPGTVNITGDLDLTAPTSTLPGDYTATVTFTII